MVKECADCGELFEPLTERRRLCSACRPTRNGRKGVFIGAYVPQELKSALESRARQRCRTLSQELTQRLMDSLRMD